MQTQPENYPSHVIGPIGGGGNDSGGLIAKICSSLHIAWPAVFTPDVRGGVNVFVCGRYP